MIEQYFKVIMPVGSDKDAPEKQHLIEQVARTHDLGTHLPKYDLSKPSFDIHRELEDLKGSLFVIADLSLERPSCYYELGIAEAIEKKIYLIARTGTTIHQTVNRKEIQYYGDMSHFQSLIDNIIQHAIQRGNGT
jgi:hypothetical protein